MRRAQLHLIVLLLTVVLGVDASPLTQDDPLLLSSGPSIGFYHKVALGVQELFNSEFAPNRLIVIPSSGSRENLARMKAGLTDWAIVQRDVAGDAYYDSGEPFRQFQVLMPLFLEAVQIFVRSDRSVTDSHIIPLKQFVEMCNRQDIRRLAVGPIGSGSNQNMKDILALYGISRTSNLYVESSFEEGFRAFSMGEIQAVAVTWAFPDETFPFNNLSNLNLVTLDDEDVRRIIRRVQNLDRVVIPSHTYRFLEQPVITVGTYAMLIARKRSDSRDIAALTDGRSLVATIAESARHIVSLQPVALSLEPLSSSEAPTSYRRSTPTPPSQWRQRGFFRGLPLSDDLNDFVARRTVWPGMSATLLLLALSTAVAVLVLRKRRAATADWLGSLEIRKNWIRHKHYIYSVVFLLGMFYVMAYLILFLEQSFSAEHLVYTPFRDEGVRDLRQWLLIFSLTGYTAGMFPVSPLAQIATIATQPLTWAAVAVAVVAEIIFTQRRKSRRSGMHPVTYENHVVICGWNERVPHLIEKALTAERESLVKHRGTRFVILNSQVKGQLQLWDDLQKLHDRKDLDFIHGDAKDYRALEKANVPAANTIILVADDRSREADERTFLRALAISRHCRRVNAETGLDKIYVIAEINNDDFRSGLLESDVNEVVCSADFTENVIIQSTFNHGLSDILHNILDYNEFNEFYLLNAREYPWVIGKSFDGLLAELRTHHVLLVAIKVVFQDNGSQIIDREEIASRLRPRGLTRQILTNPLNDVENEYRVTELDQLFVLAQDEKFAVQACGGKG